MRYGGHVKLFVTRHGRFRARLIRVALPRASLLVTDESSPRIAFVSPAPGSVVVIVPLDRGAPQTWAGIPLHPGEIMTIGLGQPAHARTAGLCRTGIVCFAAQDFSRFAGALLDPGFVAPTGVQKWQPAPSALRSLINLIRAVDSVTSAHPAAPTDAEAARSLEQELITCVLDCVAGGPVEMESAAHRQHSALMIRLEAILRAFPDRLLSLADVSAALGVSPRTLRICCQEHLGISSSRYFRLRQLQRVHRALRGGDATKPSVAEAARRYGVTELGRFAASYRDLFGQLPSETMRQAALAAPAGARRTLKQASRRDWIVDMVQ